VNAVASIERSDERPGVAVRGGLLVREGYRDALEARGLGTLDDLFAFAGGEHLTKASLPPWRQRIRFVLPEAGTLYMKRYVSPPVGEQLGRMRAGVLTGSHARLEWQRIRGLEAAGIGCVRWAAFGEERSGCWERRSVLVTAAVPGESLEAYVARRPERVSRWWLQELARFAARFHAAGWVHRDLYLCHVFFDPEDPGEPFRLIDLARVIRPRWRRRRWRVKDLAALDYSTPAAVATRADRLRFLRAYLGERRLSRQGRRLARLVARKTRRIARHDARRLRRGEAGR